MERRPDLLEQAELTGKERVWIEEQRKAEFLEDKH